MVDIRERLTKAGKVTDVHYTDANGKRLGVSFHIPENVNARISLPDNALELLNAAPREPQVSDVEKNARLTLLKMFQTTKLEEHFTFKTIRFGGKSHVQAMRTQLGKARKEASAENLPITRFKLLVVAIEQYPTHDLVTVVRSQLSSLKTKNLYGEITALMVETNGASKSDANNSEREI